MIELHNVTKEFATGSGTVCALDNVNMTVQAGTFAAIVGKSGSGKSTLLALLGALDRPTKGEVKVSGKNIARMSDRKLTIYRRSQIGFVFQQYNLMPNLSALENVMLPLEFAGESFGRRRERAQQLLTQVGLEGSKQNRRPTKLSGGEQQRVAIARALANRPQLILADEPTGNLDTQTGKTIFELLHKLSRSENTTIIAVTHDLSIAGKTDMTFRLQDGALLDK